MYSLPYFKEENPEVIEEFIAKHPFAFLSGCDAENMPVATQVPLFFENKEGKQVLRGHIMKKTSHHRAFLENENVLVVFTGHQTYVSGAWYSNPHTASTWNYMSVHIKGKIQFVDNEGLEDILRKTSLHFEGYDQQSPTIFDNLPPAYRQGLLNAIAGFEIEVLEMDNVFKLSQNRDFESYQNIIRELKRKGGGAAVISEEMEKRKGELFPKGKRD